MIEARDLPRLFPNEFEWRNGRVYPKQPALIDEEGFKLLLAVGPVLH